MARLAFWFEFASPYSYLSAMRIQPLAEECGVGIEWRPFLLGPIFRDQGLMDSPFNVFEAKGRYMWRDMARLCAKYGLPPVVSPDPFPQNGLMEARIATLAAGSHWLNDFVRQVFQAQFAQGQRLGDEVFLTEVLQGLRQDDGQVVEKARSDPAIKEALRNSGTQAQSLGIFGAPCFVTADGEVFWGDDRMEDALDWSVGLG